MTSKDTSTLLKLRKGGTDTRARKPTVRARATATDKLRALYREIKSHRITKENAEQGARDATREAVDIATQFNMRATAITFELDGVIYAGEIVSPHTSDKWDLEKVVEFAHRTDRWESVSTRVFDQEKWEAEIASGSIRPSDANKMKIAGGPGTPYVKVTKK